MEPQIYTYKKWYYDVSEYYLNCPHICIVIGSWL